MKALSTALGIYSMGVVTKQHRKQSRNGQVDRYGQTLVITAIIIISQKFKISSMSSAFQQMLLKP